MSLADARRKLRLVHNPPHRWHATQIDWLEAPPPADLEIFEDLSKSILSKNDSPDLPFTYSVNPYRGCWHGCAYCYARPTHEYLDFGAGTDFERKLVVKPQAPALLREAFDRPSWRGEVVIFSGNTDCYQPLEATYGLTRACLEVCLEYRNPVSLITKGTLIERDAELLAEIAARAHATVRLSVPFFDADVARAIEPAVPSPERRIRTIGVLAKAGVPVGVQVGPIIPGLNDSDVPKILEAAWSAGARFCGSAIVRLPGAVKAVFEERLRALLPLRAQKVLHQIEECRGAGDFGERFHGRGARWEVIESLFDRTAKRLGYEEPPPVPIPSPFRRPPADDRQGSLFPL